MATVKFSNGATVTFNGTPTQADINQVAETPAVKNYKAQPFQSNPVQDNEPAAKALITQGVPNLMNSVATPFESVAALPVQAFAKVTGQSDPYAQGMPGIPSTQSPNETNPIAPLTGAGLAQKAGQAGEIATSAFAPETTGIIKLGLLGGLSGLSQSLASGNTDPGKLAQDTAGGVAFGSALGVGGKVLDGAGDVLRSLSGINPQVANELKNAPVDLIDNYAQNAIDHESDIRAPTAHATAEVAAQNRAKVLVKQVIPAAGRAISEAKAADGALPLSVMAPSGTGVTSITGPQAIQSLKDAISSKLEDMTGYGFGQAIGDEAGLPGLKGTADESTPIIRQVPGSQKEISDSDMKSLQHLQGQLDLLQSKPTVGTASDVIHNIEQNINRNTPAFGQPQTPVNGALKWASHAINDAIKGTSPAVAAANSTYSNLMDLKSQVADEAGRDFGNASLMMRRVLSGDKSAGAISALDGLTKATQPFMGANSADKTDLVTHAVLADWATNNFGGSSAKTLLKQYTSEGSSFFGYAKGIVQTIAKESTKVLAPDPLEYAKAIASGKAYSLNPIVRLTKNVLKSAEGKGLIGAIAKKADMGTDAAEAVVENLIKMAIFHSLTAPSQPPQISPISPPLQQSAPPSQPLSSPAQQQLAPLSQASPSQNRSLSSGINKASQTALRGLTPATTGQAMSANLRSGTGTGMSLSG